nr:autotransporter outer membrane beta-barrel domain-containing protein [Rickettsia montanensis]
MTPTSNVGANQLSTGGGGSFGGTTGYNSPSTGGSSYNSPASGSDVYSPSTASSGQSGAGGSSYNSLAATGIAPANSGNSSAQGNSSSLGGTTKGGVTNSGISPYGNSGNPKATGVPPANNSNGMGSSSSSDMSAIGSSRDNSAGTSSGGSSGSGISRAKANDGFNAAQDNTSIGNQKVRERIKALEDEEDENNNAMNHAAEDATSRKRGAVVGGGDCELDESKANNPIYGIWASLYYGKAVQKAFNGLSGYKAKSTGGSIGVDTVINDNIVLGAAYTRVDTKLRYQNAKVGNTTKVGTNMGSIYGLYNFINNLFIEGVTTHEVILKLMNYVIS